MPTSDTISARSTAPGRSGRALIRLSGPATRTVVGELIGRVPGDRELTGARFLLSGGALPVLVCFFAAPRSYTGEDIAEIQLPGNPALVERVLGEINAREGVRSAQPGEFSARAFLAGKLTLDQAEGIAAAISAETDSQLAAASDLMSGLTGRTYRAWAEEVATLLALVEAGIDFTDQEDVVAISPEALSRRIVATVAAIGEHLGACRGRETASALPRIALVGRPNAGKSTLFNALLGRSRAVAGPIPGTTRDIIAEEHDLSGDVPGAGVVTLLDLAGLDEELAGRTDLEASAQAAARAAAAGADAVVWCDPAGKFDAAGLPPGIPAGANLVRVQTFADRPGQKSALAVCALDGWNLPALRRAIADAAFGGAQATLAGLLPRHRHALCRAVTALREAEATAGARQPEVTADSLRRALDSLGDLVGHISPDEVLGRVFATFCVGK